MLPRDIEVNLKGEGMEYWKAILTRNGLVVGEVVEKIMDKKEEKNEKMVRHSEKATQKDSVKAKEVISTPHLFLFHKDYKNKILISSFQSLYIFLESYILS